MAAQNCPVTSHRRFFYDAEPGVMSLDHVAFYPCLFQLLAYMAPALCISNADTVSVPSSVYSAWRAGLHTWMDGQTINCDGGLIRWQGACCEAACVATLRTSQVFCPMTNSISRAVHNDRDVSVTHRMLGPGGIALAMRVVTACLLLAVQELGNY